MQHERHIFNYFDSCANATAVIENKELFNPATSEAGKHLNNPLPSTFMKHAPADIIAVRGNPFERFKLLEYPDLVISGGHIIINNFNKSKIKH